MIIYEIRNKLNGSVYVGQTVRTLSTRIRQHHSDAFKNNSDYPIHRALRKHGLENFENEIVFIASNQSELDDMEKTLIKKYKEENKSYNLADGGQFNTWSAEAREVRSKKMKGKSVDWLNTQASKEKSLASRGLKLRELFTAQAEKKLQYEISLIEKALDYGKTTEKYKFVNLTTLEEFTSCNLREFCKDNYLVEDSMYQIVFGRQLVHRDFTVITAKGRPSYSKKSYVYVVYEEKLDKVYRYTTMMNLLLNHTGLNKLAVHRSIKNKQSLKGLCIVNY